MNPVVTEWLNVLVRWLHVIAAIMWIGDSFLFMWLDSHLSKPSKPREGEVVGELWMTHSGGFYEVIKRKSLRPEEMPAHLYWFKWESYTTWLSGFLLLVVVYYLGGQAMLTDVGSRLSHLEAVGLSLGLLLGALAVYDVLCRTPLVGSLRLFGVVGLVAVVGTAFGLSQVFTARAVFLQVGAMLGTVMASNVFFRIIPAQRHMIAATTAGQPVDVSYGARAKQRSTHNHYLTLPVLFTMLSNHFPSLYGHAQSWAVLGLLFVFGVGLKATMNFRGQTPPLMLAGTVLALISVVVLTVPSPASSAAAMAGYRAAGPVSFATVQTIVTARCVTCHAAVPTNPMFQAPPAGVSLESPELIGAHAERIFVRAVQTKTMPLGNLTGITDEERGLLGAWIAQGADVHAPGPSQLAAPTPSPAAPKDTPTFASPAEEAKAMFGTVCVPCHGSEGLGNGPVAAALNPKPRAFGDQAWQASVTDEQLAKTILEGGAAVGKSPLMPPNPSLSSKPEVLQGLVAIVRGFRKGQ
ncbi:MAG: urate hydroxylase PuuD [Myxococcaceae bacterium]|nr:urate hydroxylase PuuD [Myxococcaceae bacterium]